MGQGLTIARGAVSLGALLEALAAAGLPSSLMMVDGALCAPGAPPPGGFRDARLRTPAGTVTVKLDGAGYQVVVFGNADAALLAAQAQVAEVLAGLP
jgi:hypothetical protein